MPRSFDISADYACGVEQLHSAFREEEYWKARLADIPVDEARLESMRFGGEAGNDGTIEVVTTQLVRSHNLHALVKQLHRGDVCVRREETWGPVIDGTTTATIGGSVLQAPVSLSGTAVLSPNAESGGARLNYRFTIQVRMPLIGGKVERIIGSQLADLFAMEQRFTSEWIMDNA